MFEKRDNFVSDCEHFITSGSVFLFPAASMSMFSGRTYTILKVKNKPDNF